MGERQCTPKGQVRYVNVRGSVQWRRVFLRQACLRRIFLEPFSTEPNSRLVFPTPLEILFCSAFK